MKIILFLSLLYTTMVSAKPMLSMKEFERLTLEQQVEVIAAYKHFLRESSLETELDTFSSFRFSFITKAIASGEFDCFYAGWPSRSSRVNGKRLCISPITANPDYKLLASGCSQNFLLCQPLIFGSGLCVNIATSELKNSAFTQCENKFQESGKSLADVASELNTSEKIAELEEFVGVSERICREGFQEALCNRLRERVLAIKTQAITDPALLAAAQTAVQVTQTRVDPNVDCDSDTPGIQISPTASRQQSSIVVSSDRSSQVSGNRIPSAGRTVIPGLLDRPVPQQRVSARAIAQERSSAQMRFSSESLGTFNNGTLVNGQSLPENGEGYVQLFKDVGNVFGTTEMIGMIHATASDISRRYPGRDRLQVEDISAQQGGDIDPHGSHENGLDVDLEYYKANGVEHVPTYSKKYDDPMVINGQISPNFDVERNWELMKSLNRNGRISRIFVDQKIKNAFCKYARDKGEYEANISVLRSLRHAANHADHLHVRLNCARDDRKCTGQPPLTGGSGCP